MCVRGVMSLFDCAVEGHIPTSMTCVFGAAADLVRTRNFVKKFILMRANIQAVSLKIQTLRSQAAMANAMKGQCRDLLL